MEYNLFQYHISIYIYTYLNNFVSFFFLLTFNFNLKIILQKNLYLLQYPFLNHYIYRYEITRILTNKKFPLLFSSLVQKENPIKLSRLRNTRIYRSPLLTGPDIKLRRTLFAVYLEHTERRNKKPRRGSYIG